MSWGFRKKLCRAGDAASLGIVDRPKGCRGSDGHRRTRLLLRRNAGVRRRVCVVVSGGIPHAASALRSGNTWRPHARLAWGPRIQTPLVHVVCSQHAGVPVLSNELRPPQPLLTLRAVVDLAKAGIRGTLGQIVSPAV